MAYAPPFATALDALNAVANVADNLQSGRQRDVPIPEFLAWMDDHSIHPDWAVLDIRHPNETGPFKEKFSDIWVDLVYNQIREKYKSLPTDKTLIIVCDAGTRSYEIQIFLDSVGINNTLVLSGGFNLMVRIEPDWWPKKK
jgi:rhodanese-related sulfurtransferase